MRKALTVLISLGVLLTTACGTTTSVPEDHYYRLGVGEPATMARKINGIVEVDRFTADGLTAGRPIVYTKQSDTSQLLEYHYHFWVEAPTVLLRDQLVRYLRAANIAKNVITPEMRIEPNFAVQGRIIRLEQILGGAPRVALELEMGLKNVDSEGLVMLKTYRIEQAAQNDSVGAAVDAFNEALAEAFSRFANDIPQS